MTSGAAAVTLASPELRSGNQSASLDNRKVDVAVVGAGLAGLTTARDLTKNGISVCVLEARDRVGGRTLDHPIRGGHVVEGGGQCVGPGQDRVLALARELGIATFPSHSTGKIAFSLSGLRCSRRPPMADSADLKRVKRTSGILATTFPPDAPWSARARPRVG